VSGGTERAAPSFRPRELTAVVFAGSSGGPARAGGRNKNYFPLRGRPVVQYQLDLVRELGFRRLVVVTELHRVGELELPSDALVVESSRHQSENFAAVKAQVPFAEDERALVLFGDTPLLSEGVLRDFLRRCEAEPADFHHGLVPYVFVEPFMEFFPRPWTGRQPFHVREFRTRLGCLSLLRVAGFDPEAHRRAVETVMRGRKQDPIGGGLARHLVARARVLWGGLRFIGPLGAWMGASAILSHWVHQRGFPHAARFLRRPVSLSRLDGVARRLLGCPSRFVACPYGGASLDVDNESDLAVHERYFDDLRQLQQLQERLVGKLAQADFDLSPGSLATLERFDPEAAREIRRHPEVYRDQRRILLEAEERAGRASHAA
jgi:hypothetical protein